MPLSSSRRPSTLTLTAAALVAALGLAGCSNAFDQGFTRGYEVDPQALAQIKIGATTKEQTLLLLGTPSTTSTVGGDAWYYISQRMKRSVLFLNPTVADQRVMAIYFDKKGKVERIADYGLKDGEVFDYVTRTTPTGGAEPDFLRNIMTGMLRF